MRMCVAATWFVVAAAGQARVERVEVISRADVLEGKPFGDSGAYEKIVGKVHFKVKPEHAANRLIVDLDKAPRDEQGEVAFASDFYILRPKEAARASGSVLLEIPNRGGKGILAIMQGGKGSRDPMTEEEFGDGFLLRRGATVAWLGWQWDAREGEHMLRLHAPVARELEGVATSEGKKQTSNVERSTSNVELREGEPITGLVRADFTVNGRQEEHPLGHMISGNIGGTEYACSDPEDAANVLTVREGPFAARRTVPRSEWQFTEDRRHIRLKGGFEPGKIYEVVYRAQDPAIAGLGFAAVRDFASYLKLANNELAPATQRVHALGISQSGRFLRHFLLEGFNADEAGQRAIDGMFIHVAGAGIGSFNHRFAQPSRDAQPTTALFYPTDLFPFTDAPQKEPETGNRAGLLDRYTGLGAESGRGQRPRLQLLPKIFHTNTSYEYWSRAGSLIHTSPDGRRDVAPVENARIYLLAGLQHFSRAFPPTAETEPSLAAQHLPNPNPVRWFWRALFVAMDDWVREGKEPPESKYPKIADKTLAWHPVNKLMLPPAPSQEGKRSAVRIGRIRQELRFPKLPGVQLPDRVHDALRLDFGPEWKNRIITKQPPGCRAAVPRAGSAG